MKRKKRKGGPNYTSGQAVRIGGRLYITDKGGSLFRAPAPNQRKRISGMVYFWGENGTKLMVEKAS